MKLLFLDVDGVLNSNTWYKRYSDRNIPCPPLDREAVRRLDRIVRSTGAHIVRSTSWRAHPELSGWLLDTGGAVLWLAGRRVSVAGNAATRSPNG